jgi:hypothetical protein
MQLSVHNKHNGSNLQITRLIEDSFWRKNRGVLQKNGGFTDIILHVILRFPCFVGFLSLQAIDFQRQAALPLLQKKSYLKSYRRFSARPAMCHNRRMKVEMTDRNEGCEGWAALKCRAPLAHSVLERGATVPLSHAPRESGAGTRTPETAIQPRPLAACTSQYKSVQVNITEQKISLEFAL